MSHSIYSDPIVETPRYSAYSYPGGAVGIELKPHTTDAIPQRVKSSLPERDEHGKFNQWVVANAASEERETWLDWMKKLGKILAKEVVKEDLKRQGDRCEWHMRRTPSNNSTLCMFKGQEMLSVRCSQSCPRTTFCTCTGVRKHTTRGRMPISSVCQSVHDVADRIIPEDSALGLTYSPFWRKCTVIEILANVLCAA